MPHQDDTTFAIRLARREDAGLIVQYIRELADFEGDLDQVTATQEGLEEHMFDRGGAEALIGEWEGRPVGFAFFHGTFSTFLGRPGLALVDLYIRPEVRGRGFGRRMLAHLAGLAKERGCGRLEWWVHDWNEDAARFYRRCGAGMVRDIRVYRLDGGALDAFAEEV